MHVGDLAARILKDTFGHAQFRGAQREIVEHVITGGDAFVLMPTGGGKSLCYQIPALARSGLGVVVSPLIALMQDQVAALRAAGVRAATMNSALSREAILGVERQVRAGQLDLLYVAPERLLTERCLTLLDGISLALFAIDEAHCVSHWGHDFRPDYIELARLASRYAGVPRIALTATADATTRREIIERLRLDHARTFVASFDRPNIRYRISEKRDPRRQLLEFIHEEHGQASGIVYCLTRASVEQTAQWLAQRGVRALPYHAGLDSGVREAHQSRFIHEVGVVMVATIAFGMGIDKPDVRFVAHLDLPKSVEGYYQETGRAGRDGLPAQAWMVYGLSDVVQQRRLIELADSSEVHRRTSLAKLDAILGLCETTQCRRVQLLEYFGEPSTPCGNCDNCQQPPETWDGTEAAQKLLSCIIRCQAASGFGFGAQHTIDVLRGTRTTKVAQFNHERLSTFGIGTDLNVAEWRAVLRQLVTMRLVDVDTEHYGVLRLMAASRAVLRGVQRIELRRSSARPATLRREARRQRSVARSGAHARRTVNPGSGEASAVLFEALRAWRSQTARAQDVPAYTVFHNSTLEEIADRRPRSLEQLGTIAGIGATKLTRYGDALLELIARTT